MPGGGHWPFLLAIGASKMEISEIYAWNTTRRGRGRESFVGLLVAFSMTHLGYGCLDKLRDIYTKLGRSPSQDSWL